MRVNRCIPKMIKAFITVLKKNNYKTSYIRRRVQSLENNFIHAEMPEMVIIIVINYLLSRNQKLIFHGL
jgi:hypothetical protein